MGTRAHYSTAGTTPRTGKSGTTGETQVELIERDSQAYDVLITEVDATMMKHGQFSLPATEIFSFHGTPSLDPMRGMSLYRSSVVVDIILTVDLQVYEEVSLDSSCRATASTTSLWVRSCDGV